MTANQELSRGAGFVKEHHPRPKSGGILFIAAGILAAFGLLSVAAFRNADILPSGLYTYDEADYLFAAKSGIAANYLDKGAISIFSFVATGLRAGFDKTKWSALSLAVRSSNDITFYRHFHGPLYFYWLACCRACGISTEAHMRYATFLLLLFIAAGLAFFIHRLFPQNFILIALPPLAALMTGPSMILTVNHITPHALYLFLSLACLGLLSLFCATKQRRYWYWSLVCASLSFATLEYALFLVIALLAALFFFRKDIVAPLDKNGRRHFAIVSCACFFLPLLLLWPSGFYKLTIVKNYLYYLYFTFVRGGYYSALSPAQVWWLRFQESPAEYLFILAGIAALPPVLKKFRFLLPAAIYGLLVLATTVRNTSPFPQYISSVFPVFYLLVAAAIYLFLQGKTPIVRIVLSAAIVSFTVISGVRYFSGKAPVSLQRMPFQITSLRDLESLVADRNTPLFLKMDFIPALHYYFPDSRLYPFNLNLEDSAAVFNRIAAVLEQGPDHALLILDDENSSLPTAVEQTFTISKKGRLFISDLAPAASCWKLSLSRQEQ